MQKTMKRSLDLRNKCLQAGLLTVIRPTKHGGAERRILSQPAKAHSQGCVFEICASCFNWFNNQSGSQYVGLVSQASTLACMGWVRV